jgi:hypothetical protein
MSVIELKKNIQDLLITMDDEIKLQKVIDVLQDEEESDWASLNPEQQKEILEILEECEDEANLIPHEVVKAEYSKWLIK